MMFDQAVNGGLTTARKLLQRAVNQCLLQINVSHGGLLTVDGDIADMTRAALNDVMTWPKLGVPALVTAYRDAARERYRLIARASLQQRYLNGWLARADQLGR
jgi:lysozyme family protein